MQDPQLTAEVVRLVRSVAKVPPEVLVTAETLLVEDLGIDSLDLVGISMKVEDRFGLVIDVDEVPNFRRVADLAAHVAAIRGAEAA